MVNEETENRKALPDTTAIQKQGGALSKQLEIGILRRMLRDKQFDMPYKGFMEKLLLKGYVRASTKSPNDGQVWYLPCWHLPTMKA